MTVHDIKIYSFTQDVDDSDITIPPKPDDQSQTSPIADEPTTDSGMHFTFLTY